MLWGLSVVYVVAGSFPAMANALYGLEPAVMAIIVRALLLLARRTLKSPSDLLFAACAAAWMLLLHGSYPLIVLAAGLAGATVYRSRVELEAGQNESPPEFRLPHLARTAMVCAAAWFLPLAAAWLLLGRTNIVVAEGLLFAKAALVTFGGAYVVLPYVAEHAVALHHWLSPGDMLNGVAFCQLAARPAGHGYRVRRLCRRVASPRRHGTAGRGDARGGAGGVGDFRAVLLLYPGGRPVPAAAGWAALPAGRAAGHLGGGGRG